MRNRTLNIPIARLSKALENEEAYEVFCANVIIKEHFEFSTLHTGGKPIKALMKCLHCRYYTAKRVFDAMLKSKAVSYCEKNGVFFASHSVVTKSLAIMVTRQQAKTMFIS